MSMIKDAVLNSRGSSLRKLILVLSLLCIMLIAGEIYFTMKYRKKESVRNEQVIEVKLPDGTITETKKIN